MVEVEGNRRCHFRLPPSSPDRSLDETEIEPKPRLLRKLESAYESAQQAIEAADHGILLLIKKIIRYLESKIDPGESVMKELRKADFVEVIYPPTLQEKWVRRMFRRFVRKQLHYHRRWLVFNSFLLPLTGAMMVIPGPNVFFGWNAFRLVSHYLAQDGGRRVQQGLCQARFVPDQDLVGSTDERQALA